MPLRNTRPITIRPVGLTDAQDGSNCFAGGMASLQNLVPSPQTRSIMVPRPAATLITNFVGFNNPKQGEALLVVGEKYYGLIASDLFLNHSEPFLYDASIGAFLPVSGVTANNTPATQPTTGDWTPPQMAQVGGRVFVTSVGFDGITNFFGWFDVTGFSDTSHTGDVHSNTTVDNLSANVLQAGWSPGMLIFNALGDFAVNTRIQSIAADGLSLTLDTAALATAAGVSLTVEGGTGSNPLWCAGNTNGFPLPAVPIAVAQFSGRAWFGYNSPIGGGGDDLGAVAYSDAGAPLQITNASNLQVITFQSGLHVTALGELSFNNLLGSPIQGLIVFLGAANYVYITGDQATSNLAVNESNEAVGTLAPNSIAKTPMGLMFMAPDGLRYIDFNGRVSQPIGMNGDGVAYPFVNAVNPSRMAAAYNEDVYRCTVFGNLSAGGIILDSITFQEFWYHVKLKSWSGPHTFTNAVIRASQDSLAFVSFPTGQTPIGLWLSNTLPRQDSVYIENGLQLMGVYQTVLEPDNEAMAENSVVQSSVMIAIPLGETATFYVINEVRTILDTITLDGIGDPASTWGTMIWGSGKWGVSPGLLQQRRLPWTTLLTFKQASIAIVLPSAPGVAIGNLYIKAKQEGYLMQGLPNNP